jgi:hypothetical protein
LKKEIKVMAIDHRINVWFNAAPFLTGDPAQDATAIANRLRELGVQTATTWVGCAGPACPAAEARHTWRFTQELAKRLSEDPLIALTIQLSPPSELNSAPYGSDFVRWFKEIATLSGQCPAIKEINIDDFLEDPNPDVLTVDVMTRAYGQIQTINRPLQFSPTIYKGQVKAAAKYLDCVDGFWCPWDRPVDDTEDFPDFLDSIVALGNPPQKSMRPLLYTAHHNDEESPTAGPFRTNLDTALARSDIAGIVTYELPLDDGNEFLEIIRAHQEDVPAGAEAAAKRRGAA